MAGQPNPRPPGSPPVPGGPPVQPGKPPFPPNQLGAAVPMGQQGQEIDLSPRMGMSPHLGQSAPGGSHLGRS